MNDAKNSFPTECAKETTETLGSFPLPETERLLTDTSTEFRNNVCVERCCHECGNIRDSVEVQDIVCGVTVLNPTNRDLTISSRITLTVFLHLLLAFALKSCFRNVDLII